MTEQEIFIIMARATTVKHGLELYCSNLSIFQNHFYKLRKEHDAFRSLRLRKAPTPNHLWITNEPETSKGNDEHVPRGQGNSGEVLP